MSSLLSAELSATCSALGYYDAKANKYYADANTLETVKDLIRYLRRDDESHDIRRQLGEIKVLTNDLMPLLKSYWEQTDLFDVLLRLLVNLTTPTLMLWNEQIPTDRRERNHFLQVEDHLKSYKETFADETFWAVLSTRLSKILESNYAERGEENSLIIERILILIRNILYVPPDPLTEKRTDNDASIHDQVLWSLHQSGMLDIILYITSSTNEQAYYMHTLEILSFLLREQKASHLAQAALQRTETEKIRDEAELLSIRHRETKERQHKVKMFTGARHSRFGGSYVIKSMKSISDNELIYHKPLNKIESLNFDVDKTKPKTPKHRCPIKGTTFERRSAFSIRLFLKEFCVEFLNASYNTLMYNVKDNLARARTQAHDESYYLWTLRFFMEFNRYYKFEVKLVSETMAVQTFRYIQKLTENFYDMIESDKKNFLLWSRRLHLALLAYKELLLNLSAMDKSIDSTVRESSRVIKSNIFYILEYRELIITLLISYNELKMSNTYLIDLLETQHVFVKLLENFCKTYGSVMVQKKGKKKMKKKKNATENVNTDRSMPMLNLEVQWDEISSQLSTVLDSNMTVESPVVPFDAASVTPIDEQKSEAMKNVQRKLRNSEFENAIGLLRAAREVWPENNCFGSDNMAVEEEFLALREIFFADLGENDTSGLVQEEPIYDENDEEEDEDEEAIDYSEADFKFDDFTRRLSHPKIVKACGLALQSFDRNSVATNNCIVKLLHRIAFDNKMYVLVFQVSIFRLFQKIFTKKDFPEYKELVRFATYIIRRFLEVSEKNKKVFMEALFWTNARDVYEIENGYGSSNTSEALGRAWSEEQEDELRRLFMEHKQNQHTEDVVDWILNNLIDNTRNRRGVLKKLKELSLLVDYKRKNPKKVGVSQQQWSEEDEAQLRELYEKFRDATDPIGCIMARLEVRRSKAKLVQKLLDLELIRDRREVQKRSKKGEANDPFVRRDSESDLETDDESDDDDDESQIAVKPIRKTHTTQKKPVIVSDNQIAALLLNTMKNNMTEALEWLKESFFDTIEDFESDDTCEGIPLVPIMDYSVIAMENVEFQTLLKAMGIVEPANEQETYWRISGDLNIDIIKKYIELIQQAIDGTLQASLNDGNEGFSSNGIQEDDNLHTNLQINETRKQQQIVDGGKDEEQSTDRQSEIININGSRKTRLVFDSDSEDEQTTVNENKSKRKIIDSDSEEEVHRSINKESNKKRKVIDSDSEEEVLVNLSETKRKVLDSDSEDDGMERRGKSNMKKPGAKRLKALSSDEE